MKKYENKRKLFNVIENYHEKLLAKLKAEEARQFITIKLENAIDIPVIPMQTEAEKKELPVIKLVNNKIGETGFFENPNTASPKSEQVYDKSFINIRRLVYEADKYRYKTNVVFTEEENNVINDILNKILSQDLTKEYVEEKMPIIKAFITRVMASETALQKTTQNDNKRFDLTLKSIFIKGCRYACTDLPSFSGNNSGIFLVILDKKLLDSLSPLEQKNFTLAAKNGIATKSGGAGIKVLIKPEFGLRELISL